jgi:hypothetical protein
VLHRVLLRHGKTPAQDLADEEDYLKKGLLVEPGVA